MTFEPRAQAPVIVYCWCWWLWFEEKSDTSSIEDSFSIDKWAITIVERILLRPNRLGWIVGASFVERHELHLAIWWYRQDPHTPRNRPSSEFPSGMDRCTFCSQNFCGWFLGPRFWCSPYALSPVNQYNIQLCLKLVSISRWCLFYLAFGLVWCLLEKRFVWHS